MEILKKYELAWWILGLLLLIKVTTYKKWTGYLQSEEDLVQISHLTQAKNSQQTLTPFKEKAKAALLKTDSTLCTSSLHNSILTIDLISPNPIESLKSLEDLLVQYHWQLSSIEIKASGNMALVTLTCKQGPST